MLSDVLPLVVLVLMCLCGIGVITAVFSVRAKRRARRALGVQLLQAFRMLVKHLQMHRGLTAAQLGGESNLGGSLKSEAQVIASDIGNIARLDAMFMDNEDWQGITRHWAKLSSTRSGSDPNEIYEQHCKLIAAILTMMRYIATEYRIQEVQGYGDKTYWYELLFLGEKLGQLRALGMMRLTLSQSIKVRQKSVTRVKQTLGEIETMFHNKQLQLKIGPVYCDEINNFIATVEHYIVGGDAWISAKNYFDRASETIDLIYKSFDEEMQLLLRIV